MASRVTVLIPNYNQAALIPRVVGAFMKQSRLPDEILIIDDGSTDDSVSVLEQLSRQFPCVRYLKNEHNLGVVHSVNRGIEHAQGDYLCMYGCDDIPLQGLILEASSMLDAHPEAALCIGNPTFWPEGTTHAYEWNCNWAAGSAYLKPSEVAYRLRAPQFIHPGSGLIRKTHLQSIGGYNPELEAFTDWFAWVTLMFRHGCCYIPKPFQLCSIRDDSYLATVISDRTRKTLATRKILKALLTPEYRDVYPHFVLSNVISLLGETAVEVMLDDPDLQNHQAMLLILRAIKNWDSDDFTQPARIPWKVDLGNASLSKAPIREKAYQSLKAKAARKIHKFRTILNRF